MYIADGVNNRIRKVTISTGIISTFAGSGATGSTSGSFSGDNDLATSATLKYPKAIALDASGRYFVTHSTMTTRCYASRSL